MSKAANPIHFAENAKESFQEIGKEIQRPLNQIAHTGARYAEAASDFLLGMNGIQMAVEQMSRDLEEIWQAGKTVQENLDELNTMVRQWQLEHEILCFAIQEFEKIKEEIPQ